MGGLVDSIRRMANASRGKGYSTSGERKRGRVKRTQDALDKTFASAQMPDEEDIKRKQRRVSAKRRGSRADTVLTEDTLG